MLLAVHCYTSRYTSSRHVLMPFSAWCEDCSDVQLYLHQWQRAFLWGSFYAFSLPVVVAGSWWYSISQLYTMQVTPCPQWLCVSRQSDTEMPCSKQVGQGCCLHPPTMSLLQPAVYSYLVLRFALKHAVHFPKFEDICLL